MRIMIISDAWHPQVNGVVRTYEHITAELVKMGHEVKVVGPADFPMTIPTPGYAEIRLAIAPKSRLRRMILEFSPDHIHIATEGPLGWAGRSLCLAEKREFTTSYHTQFPDYVAARLAKFLPFLYEPIKKIAVKVVRTFHKPAIAMYVATQSLEDELNAYGFQNKKIRLLRGVKTDIFKADGERALQDLLKPVAIYVGRIAIEKNLEAFLEMEWEGSKVLVGSGPALPALERKYPDAHFVGKKVGKDLAAHYRGADVFTFPSKTDTFGIVLIEALACGLPVAAYPVMGPIDIVTEDFLGVLDNNLAKASVEALSVGTRTERCAYIHAHYTWPQVAKTFLSAFDKGEA
ncbi:MAG: glycosyltransferase family 4 protein [Pseudobdellovibrionaceae bacterium]